MSAIPSPGAQTDVLLSAGTSTAYIVALALASHYRDLQQMPEPVFNAMSELSMRVHLHFSPNSKQQLPFSSRGDLMLQISELHEKLTGLSLVKLFGTAGSPR